MARERQERPERESRIIDVDRSEHFLIPHRLLDDRIECNCRVIRALRDKNLQRPVR